jgi:hypothetical protein
MDTGIANFQLTVLWDWMEKACSSVLLNAALNCWHYIASVIDDSKGVEHWWNDADIRKPKYWEKNLSHCHSAHKSHTDWPTISVVRVRRLIAWATARPWTRRIKKGGKKEDDTKKWKRGWNKKQNKERHETNNGRTGENRRTKQTMEKDKKRQTIDERKEKWTK